MNKIAVGHFIWSAQFGGIGKVVYDLCRSQMSDNKVVPNLLIGRSSGEMIDEFRNSGIEIRELALRNGRVFSPKAYRRVKSMLEGIDIIHMHTFNPLIGWAARSTGKPIIYTVHGNFGFNRKLSLLEKLNRKLLAYFLNHHVAHITFNSTFAQEQARKFYGINDIPQSVISNGVLFKEIASAEVDKDTRKFIQNKKVIGTSSRFVEIKRINELIFAFSRISEKRPEVVLLLIGDGKLMESYRTRVKELGIEKRVHFTGFRSNVTDYQALLDVCVFPSYNEAFGLVAIETLALGKPTIVFEDGGGMADIVKQIRSDDVVKDNDQLGLRIVEYLDNEIGEKEKDELRSYAKNHDIRHMASGMYQLYVSLMQ